MFAMQVNVERMPHGLFFKFSSDRRILVFFAGTFLLAVSIASSSLFVDNSSQAGLVLLWAFWAVAAILIFVFSAFQRALFLINPIKQLDIIVKDTRREFRIASRRAQIAKPLLEKPVSDNENVDPGRRTDHDIALLAYFQLNPHWAHGSQKAIDHCIAFAHRYAEQGDYQVAGEALTAVAAINANYVEFKGRTFFTEHYLFQNPLATDPFVNATLEHIRQTVQIGIKRGDERQIEQSLRAFANLVWVYAQIDYGQPNASKTHAILAAEYLSSAVEAVVPHQMPDVLMEGVRLMGQSARTLLVKGKPEEIGTTVDKIALIACAGIANEKFRAVTLTSMEELANLTIGVIQGDAYDVQYAAKQIRKNVIFVAECFLQVPDRPLADTHGTYMAPFFSMTSMQAFPSWLTTLTKQIVNANADDEKAKQTIRHVEQWADGIYESQKRLLLRAVDKRSHFAFHLIRWTCDVTKLLMAISQAPACDDRLATELQRHARWLLFTLSWLPGDEETVTYVENLQMTETLFEVGLEAKSRGWTDFFRDTARELLRGWAFKGGKHQTGWGILEKALYGLATLTSMNDQHEEDLTYLKQKVGEYVAGPDAPKQDILDETARDIRERAATLYREGHWSSAIENAMTRVDEARLRPLLEEIADTLSPGTADEPVQRRPY